MTAETILRASSVKAKALKAYPGDTRMRLTADATTRGGNTIERGTVYQPQSGGNDAALGCAVLRVVILSEA